MKKYNIYTTLITIILVAACNLQLVYAQDISISARVDRETITDDEQVTLTVSVSGNISNLPQPQMPQVDNFTVYSSGRSQNVSIVNGRVSSSINFNYVMVPNSTGTFIIPPVKINYKGRIYATQPVKIEVVSSSAPQTMPQTWKNSATGYRQQQRNSASTATGRQYQGQRGVESPASKVKGLFIETYVDKLRAYVNEQITLTFAFYQAVKLYENPNYSPPKTTGFWSEDMPPQKKYYKTIKGVRYYVTEIKTALFATSPGEFTIEPATIHAKVEDVQKRVRRRFRDPFDIFDFGFFDDDFFSSYREGKPVTLKTQPIKIKILPLPDNDKPAKFKGDVGSFEIAASVDKNTVKEGEAITLKIKIFGDGNVKTVSEPIIKGLENFKIYDSGSSENISKDNYIVNGEKIYEKVLIPKKEGEYNLPAIQFSYFDPKNKEYKTKTTKPINIKVLPSPENKETPVLDSIISKKDVQIIGKDIRFIKEDISLIKDNSSLLYKNNGFIGLNLFPLILFLILFVFKRHQNKLKSNVKYARLKRAHSFAKKRLIICKNKIKEKKGEEFFSEIYKALTSYLADKLNLPSAGLTLGDIEENLRKKKQVNEEIISRIKGLVQDCDLYRFAPTKITQEQMKSTIKLAENLIVDLEKEL